MASYPKYKVLGYADGKHIATEWIVAKDRQDAYRQFSLMHTKTQVCYIIDKEGQGDIKKISKEEQSQMSTEEKVNTTVITVDDKVQDKDGTIRPAGKNGEAAPAVKKEAKVSEKKVKATEAKVAGKPVKATAKPAQKEAKGAKSGGKAVKAAPVKNTKAKPNGVKAVKAAPAKAKGVRSDVISATTHQAGIGDMKLSQVFAKKEQTDKLVAELRAKGNVVRVLVRKGQFAVYYCKASK